MNSSKDLLSHWTLGTVTLKNRVVMAPMTRGRAGKERIANDMMAEYYAQRSGAGLIISEATSISEQGLGWVDSPGIYSPEQIEGWRRVTKKVHAAGSNIFLQLWHCGRASHSSFFTDGRLPVAPSAIAIEGEPRHTPQGKQDSEVPRALETEEVKAIVQDYKQAAIAAKEAGFDGVEIHAANGYLIDQFLQSKTNQRQDEYGGSLENRYRFLSEITQAILEALPNYAVGVRLAPNGVFNDMGSADYRETFLYVAEQLNTLDLTYLHVMDGLAFGFHDLGEPMTLQEFRKVFSGTLMGNCGYSLEEARRAIEEGTADLIAIGRPFISNPDLVDRYQNGWELTPHDDMSRWYSAGAEGYIDYPNYVEQKTQD